LEITRLDRALIYIQRYANSRHTYAFPRIMAMLGDGKTIYDVGNDGASNELAACSVCASNRSKVLALIR
jgi:mannose-binding lectin 2